MIEVNLLPGVARRPQRRSIDIRRFVASGSAAIGDRLVISAIASVTVVAAAIAMLCIRQSNLERNITARQRQAERDSARFAVVLKATAEVEAKRDSLLRQMEVIKLIEERRFVWPHLLEEISRALPSYMWLTVVSQASPPPGSAVQDISRSSARKGLDMTVEQMAARTDSSLFASRSTRFRIVGHAMEIQAVALFMRALEASPFIQNVHLTRSDLVALETGDVTEFQLAAESQVPPG